MLAGRAARRHAPFLRHTIRGFQTRAGSKKRRAKSKHFWYEDNA
jgi:hypothetical protein